MTGIKNSFLLITIISYCFIHACSGMEPSHKNFLDVEFYSQEENFTFFTSALKKVFCKKNKELSDLKSLTALAQAVYIQILIQQEISIALLIKTLERLSHVSELCNAELEASLADNKDFSIFKKTLIDALRKFNTPVTSPSEIPINLENLGKGNFFTHETKTRSLPTIIPPAKKKRGYKKLRKRKTFICSHCKKGFSEKNNLKRHKKVHTGERPFQCPHCKHAFAEKSNLIEHIRTHTGEKPFICSHCGKAFASHSTFTSHCTTHSDKRPFKCKQCASTFKQRRILKIHCRKKHP
jgi:uncharacterized Zn-finger protein